MFVQKIIKHGNSIAVVIPAEASHAMGLKRGDLVLVVFPSDTSMHFDFKTPRNLPEKALEQYKTQRKIIKHVGHKTLATRPH